MGVNLAVVGMAVLRLISACIEASAALLMLRLGSTRWALVINSLLGIVGPTILLATTIIGVAGLAHQLEPRRMVMVLVGAGLVICGTR